MTTPSRPVLFVHGLWLHASSWQAWIDRFTEAGYSPVAASWPGDADTVAGSREHPEAIAGHGIDDVVEHLESIIAGMPESPILIGHSFGGTIVEKLLSKGVGAAAIAIDAAPIKGVLPLPISALRTAFVALKNPANSSRAVSLSVEQFRYSFGNAISEEESNALFEKWTIPAPGKPLFQAASANFSPHSEAKVDTENSDRGPLLLIMGGQDHTVPEAITKSTLKQYKHSTAVTDLLEFEDRGHSLTIDSGWLDVANASLDWLKKQGL
ncbi:alpha-beta hydrolase superfamily lysophospholipase [Jatrophihabitans sp. GAS493]|uniref:alpha/beta hydrolase n=1 Tax=Jatrophihabitans sp. GAS493 TaxID=1907575 RepID=UPI000BB77D4A|nr:alpha/beta fold hydrolase [Jatrophihabitans sp. GAS493]SOD70923.1 alpha-beta hydrolase superfamily lysophospholipase [Jatrophihabitans sp. GAS493]